MNRDRLLRAGLIGAAIALLIAGIVLFYVGLLGLYGAVDCGELAAAECAFEHETFKTIGRMQFTSGIALVGLSIALYVFVRRPAREESRTEKGAP